MEQPSQPKVTHQLSPATSVKPKQAWHKPTITFVSLQTTAAEKGSPTDGNTGSLLG